MTLFPVMKHFSVSFKSIGSFKESWFAVVKQCPLVVKMCVLANGSFLLKLINIAGCSDKQRHFLLQMKVCKPLQIPLLLITFYNMHITKYMP